VEGIARHSSTHAAGVVISREPLVEHVPLQRAGGKSEGEITTQYQMGHLEELGLLKMDFLGLSTLSILGRAVQLAQRKDPGLRLETIPLEDDKGYERLRRGETVGIFQLEGGMTSRMTVDVCPSKFEDLVALMALIRPGPMEMAPDYIARKRGRTPIRYAHPSLEPILKETYGVALYQEQVMQIAHTLAGFSMAEADGLRKGMGKKLPEVMAKYRDRFIQGATENGIDSDLAAEIWEGIDRFGGYGFNKSHSAAYAVIAAQTAYMKANYPVEFMAALMTNDMGNSDRIAIDVSECRRAGIEVLPPDINRSDRDFSVETTDTGAEAVRFGLSAVKNVGEGAVRAVLEARAGQPDCQFPDLETFCREVDWDAVTKRAVECLAKSGVLDAFGGRAAVLAKLEPAIAAGQRHQKASAKGQMGLFVTAVPVATVDTTGGSTHDISRKQLLAWEKEFIGLYLSDHPLNQVMGASGSGGAAIATLPERESGDRVTVVGMVTGVRRLTTKANKSMVVVEIEDLTGSIELVAFPEAYERHAELWEIDAILEVVARVDRRGDQLQLVCESATAEVRPVSAQSAARTVRIRVPVSEDVWADIRALQALDEVLDQFEGDDDVVLILPRNGREVTLRSRKRRVAWGEPLAAALRELLAEGAVSTVEPAAAM
jgi:DNA polymerase-3 subunit alpha